MSKLAMKLFENKEECCGCTACYSVCPTSAISMQQDEEGAYYPVIEQSRCIGCRKCERVCSFKKALKTQDASSDAPKVYAARIKDEKELTASSSGGMFTALSDLFLSSGNAVACSVYDTVQYEVRYVLISSVSERDQARGSKYMKSSLKNIFSEAQQWLEKNPQKKLLFVGMGCEVDGFRSFAEAKKLRDRVVLADIICHGGSSQLVWKQYAEYIQEKNRQKIQSLHFKDKRIDWYHPTPVAAFADQKEVSVKQYVKLFNSACAYRPSCYQCPYATIHRSSDITIGDFWGVEKVMPAFYHPKGNSLVLVHTAAGAEIFEKIKPVIDWEESNAEDCLQENLIHPTRRPSGRDAFWRCFRERGIKEVLRVYGNVSVTAKIKKRLNKLFH